MAEVPTTREQLAEHWRQETARRSANTSTGIADRSFRDEAAARTDAAANVGNLGRVGEILDAIPVFGPVDRAVRAAVPTAFGDEARKGMVGTTFLGDILERALTRPDFEDAQGFDASRDRMADLDTVPWGQQGRLRAATSPAEFDWELQRHRERQREAAETYARGGTGALGNLIGSMIDVDLPLIAMPGAGLLRGTRALRAAKAAAMGGTSGATINLLGVASQGDDDWASVALGGALGIAMGAAAGGVGPGRPERIAAERLHRGLEAEIAEVQIMDAISDVHLKDTGRRADFDAFGIFEPKVLDAELDFTPNTATAVSALESGFVELLGRIEVERAPEAVEGTALTKYEPTAADFAPEALNETLGDIPVKDRGVVATALSKVYQYLRENGTTTAAGGTAVALAGLATLSDDEQTTLQGYIAAGLIGGMGSIRPVSRAAGTTPTDHHIQKAQTWWKKRGQNLWKQGKDLRRMGGSASWAKRIEDGMAKNSLLQFMTPEFQKWVNHPSAVVKKMAYELLENPTGWIVNNKSAAALREMYLVQGMSPMRDFHKGMNEYLKKLGQPWWKRTLDERVHEPVYRDIVLELNNRRLGRKRTTDADLAALADAVNASTDASLAYSRGRGGERTVPGFDGIKENAKEGYFPTQWMPQRYVDAVKKLGGGKKGEKRLVKGLAKAIRSANKGIDPEVADAFAMAMVRRAKEKNIDGDTSLIGLLDQDARAHLEGVLKDNGIPQSRITGIMSAITGVAADRGKTPHAKGRIPIDWDYDIGNGVKVVDLFNTDIPLVMERYHRRMAGNAALARVGLGSTPERTNTINAALQDQDRLLRQGKLDPKLQLKRDDIAAMLEFFTGAPLGGEKSQVLRRMRQFSRLVFLPMLGATQLAEWGAQMYAAGVKQTLQNFRPVLDTLARGDIAKEGQLARELRFMGSDIFDEELLFRPEMMLDETSDPKGQLGFWGSYDRVIRKAERIMGHTSAFYYVRAAQQRTAVAAMNDTIATFLTTGKPPPGVLPPKAKGLEGVARDPAAILRSQLKSIGIEGRRLKRITAEMKKHVRFDPQTGAVSAMNLHLWDRQTVDDYVLAINRHAAQVVQKGFLGEEPLFFSTDVGSFITHLKKFPLLAINKQLLRSGRVYDGKTLDNLALLGITFATSAMAVIAREELGKGWSDDKYRDGFIEHVAKGALAYSNITGFVPMGWDPVATMLGLDDLRFYNFGPPGQIANVPAPISAINNVAGIPQAVFRALSPSHDMRNRDWRALNNTPVFGRMYGMGAALRNQGTLPGIPDPRALSGAASPVPAAD